MSTVTSWLFLLTVVGLFVGPALPLLRRAEGRCHRDCVRACCMPAELHPYLNDDVPASLGGSRDASNPDRWRL